MLNAAYKCFFYSCFGIYIFKQLVSIIQIFGASQRIAEWDAKIATDKLNERSS